MLKKFLVIIGIVLLAGFLIAGAVNRTLAKAGTGSSGEGGYGHGNGAAAGSTHTVEDLPQADNARGAVQSGQALSVSTAELSPEEEQALLYMREEEKLAHDVYTYLYDMWGLNTFQNISRSEQAHTEAVLRVMTQYNLADPAFSTPGVFSDPELQALYEQLIQQGSQSLVDAIRVGAAIEEIDILDLQSRLAQTSNAEVQQVFSHLLSGSTSHLQAFASVYQNQTGEAYQPVYLGQADYQALLEAGGSGGFGGQGSGQGGGYRGGRP